MPRFLFFFGFCTPMQWEYNESHGTDDESSLAIFIDAVNRSDAIAFGRDIAELYNQQLFESAEWNDEIPSWKKNEFAFWIDDDVGSYSQDFLASLPIVMKGVIPDFSNW